MNKLAKYLNRNLAGEAVAARDLRKTYSNDSSVLNLAPQAVVFPRNTADVRKTCLLAYQLAEKTPSAGVGVTARGFGSDKTGGAIGGGLVMDLSKHYHRVLDMDPAQGLIHVQAGIELDDLSSAAVVHALRLPMASKLNRHTIGGALAGGLAAPVCCGKSKDLSSAVSQLEVVLSNGDLIQCRPLNKRELSRKIGQADFEGQIYRAVDALLEENADLIASIDTSKRDNLGYANIAKVKQGSTFDLTPLFMGSGGTLGVISEVILKLEPSPEVESVVALSFVNIDDVFDASDALMQLAPDSLDFYELKSLKNAILSGKNFGFLDAAAEELQTTPKYVLMATFSGSKERSLQRTLNKVSKIAKQTKVHLALSSSETFDQMLSLLDSDEVFVVNGRTGLSNINILEGIYIPQVRLKEFRKELTNLEKQLNFKLGLSGSLLLGIYNVQLALNLAEVSDKQRMYKLLDSVSLLVQNLGGVLCASGHEGRLKTYFAYRHLSPEILNLYSKIRDIFDPNGSLNPGVKQPNELRNIIAMTLDKFAVKFD